MAGQDGTQVSVIVVVNTFNKSTFLIDTLFHTLFLVLTIFLLQNCKEVEEAFQYYMDVVIPRCATMLATLNCTFDEELDIRQKLHDQGVNLR